MALSEHKLQLIKRTLLLPYTRRGDPHHGASFLLRYWIQYTKLSMRFL